MARQQEEYIRKIVREELELFTKGELAKILKQFNEDLIIKLKLVEKNINLRVDEKEKEAGNKQLALINQNVNKQITTVINTNLMPRIQQLTNLVEHRTFDESVMLHDYREQVMGMYNPEIKQLTSGESAGRESSAEFQRSMFVFNDED